LWASNHLASAEGREELNRFSALADVNELHVDDFPIISATRDSCRAMQHQSQRIEGTFNLLQRYLHDHAQAAPATITADLRAEINIAQAEKENAQAVHVQKR
jgi:hypothetical protein